MSVLQARWETGLASWIESTFDEDNEPYRVAVAEHFHLTRRRAEQLRQFLTPLFLAVGAVLLIACANIAILLLARASARQREMGIRAALGASRARVVAQLLTESLLLAGLGSAFGIAIAYWAANLAAGLIPMSFAGDFRPDLSVIGFTLALAAGAAVLFGLVPALQLSRADITVFLHRLRHSRSRANIRNALVVGQLTLSIVLVTGAGLFVRSLLNAQRVNLGFDQERKLLLDVIPANHGYAEDESKEFVRLMVDRLETLPGIRHTSITDRVPFRGMWTSMIEAPGTEFVEEQRYESGFNRVGPGYFESMGIPIVAGREFGGTDDAQGPNVVIVNEHVAEEVWPGENAVGKTISRMDRDWTVIGVARNAVYYDIGEEPRAQTYHAFLQNFRPEMTFAIATAGDPMAMVSQVQQVIRDFDPNMAIFNIRTLDDVVARELGQFRVMAILVVLFGALALFLSAVGLYGVQSFLVARRTREIGIRMALGAFERQVAGAVLGRGVSLAAVGVALGIITAYASAQFIQSLLFGVEARDPLIFVMVPIVLLLVSAAASLIPAMRASRVDPVEALREE
jgi:predicted permease